VPERTTASSRSEKSAEVVVAVRAAKGRTMGRAKRPCTSGELCHRSRMKVWALERPKR